MPEVFQKGAHIIPIKIAQGNRGAEVKITIKQPVSIDTCSHRVGARSDGDIFVVKPRGSPNIWKIYEVVSGQFKILGRFKNEYAAIAYARLMYG